MRLGPSSPHFAFSHDTEAISSSEYPSCTNIRSDRLGVIGFSKTAVMRTASMAISRLSAASSNVSCEYSRHSTCLWEGKVQVGTASTSPCAVPQT